MLFRSGLGVTLGVAVAVAVVALVGVAGAAVGGLSTGLASFTVTSRVASPIDSMVGERFIAHVVVAPRAATSNATAMINIVRRRLRSMRRRRGVEDGRRVTRTAWRLNLPALADHASSAPDCANVAGRDCVGACGTAAEIAAHCARPPRTAVATLIEPAASSESPGGQTPTQHDGHPKALSDG